MFTSQKPTGSGLPTTVAYLAMAFIFGPALLVVSRPAGYMGLSLAVACSAVCVALAWMNWRESSPVSVASTEPQKATAK